MSNAKEIGTKLVNLCREGKNLDAINNLYADNVVSVEAVEGGGFPREMSGKEAVLGKGKWWGENHEVHSSEVSGPFPHGDNKFAVRFNMDVTSKPMNNTRMQLDEVGVYEVEDGKIVREEFFYDMGQ